MTSRVRFDVCTLCELRCPSCVQSREALGFVRRGWPPATTFDAFLAAHPAIRGVELSNWGEVFLNPELPAILECAHARGVEPRMTNGVHLNRDVVAKPVKYIAELAGLEVPEGTRFLMALGTEPGPKDRFSGEKICLVLTVWKWTDFDEIVDRVGQILKFSGEGHSVSIHSENKDRHLQLALRSNVGRVNCNMPHAMANSGSWFNGQPFTDSLGCGTWAGNMTTDNINYRHFLNYTWLSRPIPEHVPSDEELFGDYLAKWERD